MQDTESVGQRFRYLLSHLIFLKYAILSILFQVQHCSTNTVEICRVYSAIRIDKFCIVHYTFSIFRQAAKAVDRKVAQGPDLSKAPRSMVNSGWVKVGQNGGKHRNLSSLKDELDEHNIRQDTASVNKDVLFTSIHSICVLGTGHGENSKKDPFCTPALHRWRSDSIWRFF